MTTIADIVDLMEYLAPPELAETWDNVGLLVGDAGSEVKSVVLSVDATPRALALADAVQAELIITHHPVIFTPITSLNYNNPEQRALLDVIQKRRAIFSAHTNLDCAVGGVNDALMQALDLVPDATLSPSEVPYERPALSLSDDILPSVGPGLGRMATLEKPETRFRLATRVNHRLQTAGCLPNFDEDAPVNKVAVVGGSFSGELIDRLEAEHVDFLISGEIKHNHMLAMEQRGIAAVAAGHEATERVILHPLAQLLSTRFPDVRFAVNMGLDYNDLVF